MSTIITIILTAGLLILVLSSDILPWKIVSRSEIDDLHEQVAQARALAVKAAAAPEKQHGGWMWDPNYKNPLDKVPTGHR